MTRNTDQADATPRKLPFKPRLTGAERRARILEVGLEEFARSGYEQTSMGAIADRTAVTRAVLYRYFPSKQGLYLAILEHQTTEIGDFITHRLKPAKGIANRLHIAAHSYLEFAEQHPQTWALLLDDTATEPECSAGRRHLLDTVIGTGLEALADDITQMGYDITDPRTQLSMHFVIDGLNGVIRWWREHPQMSVDEVINTIELLLTNLGNLGLPTD